MSKPLGLAATLLVVGALSIAPASAHGHHHHPHHGHHHGHPHHGHRHGGWHPAHGHAGWHRPWGGGPQVVIDRRPLIVRGGPRPVTVVRGYGAFASHPGYGCSTRQRVGLTDWGMRKVVTTRTCLVP